MPAQVRARHLKSLMEAIDRQPRAAEIRARIAAPVLVGIDEAFGFDWCPMAWDLDVTRAVADVLQEGLHPFFDAAQRASFEGPLLKTLVETGLRIFGADAGTAATWIPRGWHLVFQECGRWRIDRGGPGRVELSLEGLPPECVVDDVWPRSVAGSLSAVAAVTSRDGIVQLNRVDRAAGAVSFSLVWTA